MRPVESRRDSRPIVILVESRSGPREPVQAESTTGENEDGPASRKRRQGEGLMLSPSNAAVPNTVFRDAGPARKT